MSSLTPEQRRGLTARQLEAFTAIERAAIAKARCPMDAPHGPLPYLAMRRLRDKGFVSTQNFGRNWRVATLLAGPFVGQKTKPAPNGAAAHPPQPSRGKVAP
jgi:hypothetical protein